MIEEKESLEKNIIRFLKNGFTYMYIQFFVIICIDFRNDSSYMTKLPEMSSSSGTISVPRAIYVEFFKYIQGLPCTFMNGNQNIESSHVKQIHSTEAFIQQTDHWMKMQNSKNEMSDTAIKTETFPPIQLPVRAFLLKNNQIEFEAMIYDMDNLQGNEYFACRADVDEHQNSNNGHNNNNKRKRSVSLKNSIIKRRASTFIQITHAPQNYQHLVNKLYCNLSTALSCCRNGTTASGWQIWCIEITDPITHQKKMVPMYKFRSDYRYLSGHWVGGGFSRCSRANSVTRDIMQHFAEKPRITGGERYCQRIHSNAELREFDPQKKSIEDFTLHELNTIYKTFLCQ